MIAHAELHPPEDVQTLKRYMQQLLCSSQFLGALFESGRDPVGRPVTVERQARRERRIAYLIHELYEKGYELALDHTAGLGGQRVDQFARYYSGDLEQNPALITAEEEVMDIVDFCKQLYRGGRLVAVPRPETLACYAVINQARAAEEA